MVSDYPSNITVRENLPCSNRFYLIVNIFVFQAQSLEPLASLEILLLLLLLFSH